jgi:hypothetical protein
MQLSVDNRNSLLLTLHKQIEEYADVIANTIFHGRPVYMTYPPNAGLTIAEEEALQLLKGNEQMMTALRKVLASNTSDVFFSFFNVIDGTASPDVEVGSWSEVMLVDKAEDFPGDEFLHDEFYGTYWDWKERRGNKGWSLDVLE